LKIYATIRAKELSEVPALATRVETLGFDGISIPELAHDSFLAATLAAEHTRRIAISTDIALAFPRSPMTLAYIAWDLQRFSNGRFQLGLGSQVKGHIERRFSTTWGSPKLRLREYSESLRAIWDCWQNGTPLNYHGNRYSFTLMPPEFNPGPIEHPAIPISLAAVGPGMCQVAGESFDGVSLHPFSTARYTKDVSLPAIVEGTNKSCYSRKSEMIVTGGGFIVTGAREVEVEYRREETRKRIAFYGSTRTYKRVLDCHGWGETSLRLHEMSLQGRWDDMVKVITDTMLEEFCTSGTYDAIAPRIKERYESYANRISLEIPMETKNDSKIGVLVEELQKLTTDGILPAAH
jgi:probable F420-dependent oxidoreductase